MKKNLFILFIFFITLVFTKNNIISNETIYCESKEKNVIIDDLSFKTKTININFDNIKKEINSNRIDEKNIFSITNSKNQLFIKEKEGYYVYCPSIIKEDNVYHNFYCSNSNSFEIIDSIYYRQCIEGNNSFIYEEEIEILKPSLNEWDSMHVCDPTIIEGQFLYNNNSYKYLMAYLGCNTIDNQQNKIGFAVSNYLDKEWIKTKEINPIINISYDKNHKDSFQWGVGQPSLINLDKKGNILVFYTKGTYNLTSQVVELWNLSNLNKPIKIWSTTLNDLGMNDFISNADFIYNDNELYMICDNHPFDSKILSNIPNSISIYKTNIEDFFSQHSFEKCKWNYVYKIDKNITNYEKNHNSCFVRTFYGEYITNHIAYSYAIEKENFAQSLWSYRYKLLEY